MNAVAPTPEDLAAATRALAEAQREARDLGAMFEARTRELRAAEARYRAIFENAAEGIFQTAPTGRLVAANPALARIFGYDTPEELIAGLSDIGRIYVDAGVRDQFARRLREQGVVSQFEKRVYRKDGSVIWISANARAVRDESGALCYYEGTVRDITGQRQAREAAQALHEVGRELTGTLEPDELARRVVSTVLRLFRVPRAALYRIEPGSGEMVCVAEAGDAHPGDRIGRRIPADHGIVGRAAAEGCAVWSADLLEDSQAALPAWLSERVRAEGYRAAIAVPLMARDQVLGTLILRDRPGRTFGDEERQLLSAFASQSAVALRSAQLYDDVRAARDFLQSITQNSPDAIVTTDIHGRLSYFSPGASAIFGYGPDEVLGTRVADFYLAGETEAHAVMRRLRAEGQIRNHETAFRTRDGREVAVSASFSLLRAPSGETIGTLGVIRDVSEAKRAERELEQQRQALHQSEKLAAMGSLLAGVAHELNNPLAVVLGQARFLQQSARDETAAARAEKLLQAAERCARIVRNFLALARQQPTERQKVALNRVAEEAVELLAYPLRVDGVGVMLDLAPDLPALWADPHQLHQVVVNLVGNAHYAMRHSAPPRRLRVATRADPARARVTLEVADTGPGIPPEVQARIFEPFFTTKPPGQGTGLGLSLCRGIVEAHGGSIGVESRPGDGAVFRIELPVEAPPFAAHGVKMQAAAAPVPAQTILVVDDEADVAELVAEMLAIDGHRAETAANAAIALDMLRERTYDLVLTDLRMPGVDGPGLYRELEARHPQLVPRCIFLTGDDLSPDMARFLGDVGAVCLSKPFTLEEVRRAIHRVHGVGARGPAATAEHPR